MIGFKGSFVAAVLMVGCGDVRVVFDGAPPDGAGALSAPLNGQLVIANRSDDLLSIVAPISSAGGPTQIQMLPVGFNPVDVDGPRSVHADPQGRFVYVNLSLSDGTADHASAHGGSAVPGWLVKLDAHDGREVARVEIEPNPGDIAITADGSTIYVSHYDVRRWSRSVDPDLRARDSDLLVISTSTLTVTERLPLCPAAHGLQLSPDERRLFATCSTDEIAIVDLSPTGLRVQRMPLMVGPPPGTSCVYCPYRLSLAPDGTIWVSSLGGAGGALGKGTVHIFEPDDSTGGSFNLARTIRLDGSPGLVAFQGSAASYRAYVPEHLVPPSDHHGNTTSAGPDHLRTFEVLDPLTPPKQIGDIVLEPSACVYPEIVYVQEAVGQLICKGKSTGTIAWLDLDASTVQGVVGIGGQPDGATMVPAAR